MSTQPTLPFTQQRETKKQAIVRFFAGIFGARVSSNYLHSRFGSSFRTRVSEINRDLALPLIIKNETNELDQSVYWSEAR